MTNTMTLPGVKPRLRFLVAAFFASACADLTRVQAPDVVQRPDLASAAGAIAFFNGAVGSFNGVFGSAGSNAGPFVTYTGLLSDELTAAGILQGGVQFDQHVLTEASGSFGVYGNLQLSRIHQLQTLSVLKQVLPAQRWRIGQIYGLLAHLETMLGETMCSGVPLSSLAGNFAPVYGAPLTTTQLFEAALVNFDSAIVYATDSSRILNMARLGRGRTLLNLNRPADAAAAVSAVPTNAVFVTDHTTGTPTQNTVAVRFLTQRYQSIADNEGSNGLNFVSANDPRIAAVTVGLGLDGTTTVYRPARLSGVTSPNILAHGTAARLIEAEAALAADDVTLFMAKLNELRTTAIAPAMTTLADPGTPDSRVDLLFRERAFWLFLTGHRNGDMRRLVRHYGRAPAAVYPIGSYKYGSTFGEDLTVPIDQSEITNNPLMNGTGCLDRNP